MQHAGEPVIKKRKHIRQSTYQLTMLTGDTLKVNAIEIASTAIVIGLEYDPGVRSVRSSPRAVTPSTWRRGAVIVYQNR